MFSLADPLSLCALQGGPFLVFCFFFFNYTATTEIYTLSLHDALPIFFERSQSSQRRHRRRHQQNRGEQIRSEEHTSELQSRFGISHAAFCLKKKQRERPLGHPARCHPQPQSGRRWVTR